uniref:Mobile element protein n=1 Tax=Macrostomum lignano TaxID=282301 RepID=A0A1I8H0W3_9PLAT
PERYAVPLRIPGARRILGLPDGRQSGRLRPGVQGETVQLPARVLRSDFPARRPVLPDQRRWRLRAAPDGLVDRPARGAPVPLRGRDRAGQHSEISLRRAAGDGREAAQPDCGVRLRQDAPLRRGPGLLRGVAEQTGQTNRRPSVVHLPAGHLLSGVHRPGCSDSPSGSDARNQQQFHGRGSRGAERHGTAHRAALCDGWSVSSDTWDTLTHLSIHPDTFIRQSTHLFG